MKMFHAAIGNMIIMPFHFGRDFAREDPKLPNETQRNPKQLSI
jgi:hypothetical protein